MNIYLIYEKIYILIIILSNKFMCIYIFFLKICLIISQGKYV